MSINPYLRLFGAFVTVPVTGLLIAALFGRQAAMFMIPALFVTFFGALITSALISGSVWFAERGGSGAYKISRNKDSFWYWMIIILYGAIGIAFASFYISR
jgi:hypothetical protein